MSKLKPNSLPKSPNGLPKTEMRTASRRPGGSSAKGLSGNTKLAIGIAAFAVVLLAIVITAASGGGDETSGGEEQVAVSTLAETMNQGGIQTDTNARLNAQSNVATNNTPNPQPTAGTSNNSNASNSGSGSTSALSGDTYTVQAGDNGFWGISEKVYGTGIHYNRIKNANPNLDPHRLQPGMVVQLPQIEGATARNSSNSANTNTETPGFGPGGFVNLGNGANTPTTQETSRVTSQPRASTSNSFPERAYTVKAGDTIYTIARDTNNYGRFGSTHMLNLIRQIRHANPGIDFVHLQAGQTIVLPEMTFDVPPMQ